MQRPQKKSDRTEGQPVGEMNSPQGVGRGCSCREMPTDPSAALAIDFRESVTIRSDPLLRRVHRIRPVKALRYSRLRSDSEVEVNKDQVSVWSNSGGPHVDSAAACPASRDITVPIETRSRRLLCPTRCGECYVSSASPMSRLQSYCRCCARQPRTSRSGVPSRSAWHWRIRAQRSGSKGWKFSQN